MDCALPHRDTLQCNRGFPRGGTMDFKGGRTERDITPAYAVETAALHMMEMKMSGLAVRTHRDKPSLQPGRPARLHMRFSLRRLLAVQSRSPVRSSRPHAPRLLSFPHRSRS